MNIKEYVTVTKIDEALDILNDFPEKYTIMAGATDVIPKMRDSLIKKPAILDIYRLKQELSYIETDRDNNLRIGALTTHSEIIESKLIGEAFGVLASACKTVGSAQIRNRATIGGNIMNASPAADTLPYLIAADAKVVLLSKSGQREIRLSDFIISPGKTSIRNDEILKEIVFDSKCRDYMGIYKKLGQRKALTISIASVCVLKKDSAYRVVYGALSPKLTRASKVENYLNGKDSFSSSKLGENISQCVNPISDIRATKDYRIEMASNLTKLSLIELGCKFDSLHSFIEERRTHE